MSTLSRVSKSGLGQAERAALEDLLCSLVSDVFYLISSYLCGKRRKKNTSQIFSHLQVRSGGWEVAEDLVEKHGAASVCQAHGLRELQGAITRCRRQQQQQQVSQKAAETRRDKKKS